MGRLTEYFEIIKAEPNNVQELKQTLTHIDVDRQRETINKLRREFRKEKKSLN